MNTLNVVLLEVSSVRFYSSGDEKVFFGWLDALPAIRKVEGFGETLQLILDRDAVDEEALRDLIALFYRYEINKSQLSVFDCEQFSRGFAIQRLTGIARSFHKVEVIDRYASQTPAKCICRHVRPLPRGRIRFESGQSRTVTLVEVSGDRIIYGFRQQLIDRL